MIKLGIAGVAGRMGRRIYELAMQDKRFEVTLGLERKGIPLIGRELGKLKISSSPDGFFLTDVVIDFTLPEAAVEHLDSIARYKKPLVLGTTGLSAEQVKKVEEVARVVPIVYSPNMAVGVNTLFEAVADLSRRLGPEYSAEIVEAHHKGKKDAPSGTAKKFAAVLREASGREVSVHAVRLGDIVGDHTIIFCGNSERIEIRHQAHTRDLFAVGALKAAAWLVDKPAGLYTMQDVLKK